MTKHGHFVGGRRTPTYHSWAKMLERCRQPNRDSAQHYYAKGIKPCERWLKFENFLADMGERPEGCTLDRINNSKGYEPANCRWATQKQQMRNQDKTIFLEYAGRRLPLREWAEQVGISYWTLRSRLQKMQWPAEKILTTPVRGHRRAVNPPPEPFIPKQLELLGELPVTLP